MENSAVNEQSQDKTEVVHEIPKWLTEEIFIGSLKNDIKDFDRITKFLLVPAVSTGENFMTQLLRALIEVKLKGL